MVCGQLHYEGRGLAGEPLSLLEHDSRDYYRGHADEVSGGSYPCGTAEYGAGNHSYKGNLSAAGNKCGGHYGHTPVALILYGTGGHYSGDTAAGADQHGDEGLAGKAEPAEEPVQNERDTGHIAAVLKGSKKQEQHQHLRNKAEDRADAGDYAVKYQAAEPLGTVALVQSTLNKDGDAGDPYAVVGRIRLFADFLKGGLCSLIILEGSSFLGNRKGLLVLYLVGKFAVSRLAVFFDIRFITVNYGSGLAVFFCYLIISG